MVFGPLEKSFTQVLWSVQKKALSTFRVGSLKVFTGVNENFLYLETFHFLPQEFRQDFLWVY